MIRYDQLLKKDILNGCQYDDDEVDDNDEHDDEVDEVDDELYIVQKLQQVGLLII